MIVSDDSKKFFFIPGEILHRKACLFNCSVALTNFRLYLISHFATYGNSECRSTHIGVPIHLISKIEQVEFKYLKIWTKLGNFYTLVFEKPDICNDWLSDIVEKYSSKKDQWFSHIFFKTITTSFPKSSLLKSFIEDFDKILWVKEYKRMIFGKQWKITDVNSEFQICGSYPRYHIVPSSITDKNIEKMAAFRGNNRFPSVVWRSQRSGAVIIRCAQPLIGLIGWRNEEDETFVREVMNCLDSTQENKKLAIIDARHYATAQFNRIRGGGVEYSDYYSQAEIKFMQLENIHNVRDSFDSITFIAMNSDSWYTGFETSYWLKYVSKLLKSASDIARTINEEGRSVIIHCSDGWDRTPQLTSLTQIFLDSYYRTIEGFQVLIEKEWIQFGHKFADRCGFMKPFDNKERSPVFVLWLDCIHQLLKQFPTYFEFNETFLIKLAIHAHSGLFGEFLYNNEEDRLQNNSRKTTISIWNYLCTENEQIKNPLYYKRFPWYPENDRSNLIIYPIYQTKYLVPWNRLFFEALNPVNIHKIFSFDYCATQNQDHTNFPGNSTKDYPDDCSGNVDITNNAVKIHKSKSESDLLHAVNVAAENNFKTLTVSDTDKVAKFNKIDSTTILDNAAKLTDNNNSRFINQSDSVSQLNVPLAGVGGVSKQNGDNLAVNGDGLPSTELSSSPAIDDADKIVSTSHCETLPAGNVGFRTTFQKTELYPLDTNMNTNVHTNANAYINNGFDRPHSRSEYNKREDELKYFQMHNVEDDKNQNYISAPCDSSPCDIDGIFKVTESINVLASHWNSVVDEKNHIIKILCQKLGFEIDEYPEKVCVNSGSVYEKQRNEDSVSSHGSYVMLDARPLKITNGGDGHIQDNNHFYNRQLASPTSCSQIETGSSHEKAQGLTELYSITSNY